MDLREELSNTDTLSDKSYHVFQAVMAEIECTYHQVHDAAAETEQTNPESLARLEASAAELERMLNANDSKERAG
jgi:hypothetical protein